MSSLTKRLALVVGLGTSLAGGAALAQAEETKPAEEQKASAEATAPGAEVTAEAEVDKEAKPEAKADTGETASIEAVKAEAEKEEKALEKVMFEFDSATLTAEGKKEIYDVAKKACADRKQKITLEGHADEIGDASYNAELAARRAQAVRDELEKNGIEAGRIETVVFGELKPVVDEPATVTAQEPNRRVAIYYGEGEMLPTRGMGEGEKESDAKHEEKESDAKHEEKESGEKGTDKADDGDKNEEW